VGRCAPWSTSPRRLCFKRISYTARPQEVPGEDPVLTSEYVKHFSQGLMHGDTDHVDVDTEHLQIISTCKHFAGYDIETGRSGNNVNISARMLTEYYLPVFKTCVQVAKVKSIMCSYNGTYGAGLRVDF
jgi:beta-D-xylosidase 4